MCTFSEDKYYYSQIIFKNDGRIESDIHDI